MRRGTLAPVALVGTAASLACGLGTAVAGSPLAALLPLGLAAVAGLWIYTELGVLMLQDYMQFLTTPLGWFVPLPAIPMSLPFLGLWGLSALWAHVFGKRRFVITWGLLLHILFACVVVVGYLGVGTPTPYASTKVFFFLTLNFISYVAGATFSRESLGRVFVWIVFFGVLVALLTYQAFFAGTQTMAGRFSALGMNPIWSCRLGLMGAMALFLIVHGRAKLWAIAFAVAVFPAAILTGSRGPLLATAVTALAMTVAWWLSPAARPAGKASYALIAAVLCGGLVLGTFAPAPAVAQEVRSLGDSGTAESRTKLYATAFDALGEHLLFGLGLGGFEALVDQADVGEALPYPHNMFLEVAVELGLFGLIAFLVLIGYFGWLSLRHIRFAKHRPRDPTAGWGLSAVAGFLSLLVASQFSGDITGNHAMWFFMGLMSAIETHRGEETEGRPA